MGPIAWPILESLCPWALRAYWNSHITGFCLLNSSSPPPSFPPSSFVFIFFSNWGLVFVHLYVVLFVSIRALVSSANHTRVRERCCVSHDRQILVPVCPLSVPGCCLQDSESPLTYRTALWTIPACGIQLERLSLWIVSEWNLCPLQQVWHLHTLGRLPSILLGTALKGTFASRVLSC